MRKQVFLCLAVLIVFELVAAHWRGDALASGSSAVEPQVGIAAATDPHDEVAP